MALISLADAKTYLGTSGTDDDTLITAMIAAAIEAMEQYAGRHLDAYTRTEVLDGTGRRRLYLAEPAESITSVHSDSDQGWGDSNLVAAADYDLDGCAVDYLDRIWTRGKHNVRVIYAAGFVTVPDDLQHACKVEVNAMYTWWQADKAGLGVLKSQNVEGWSQTFRDRVDLEPAVRAVCQRYRAGRL